MCRFALSENGDTVYLSSAEPNGVLTGYRDVEDFGASLTDVSFGRYHLGSTDNYNFVAMSAKTPNNPNAYPKVGPIVINEIMYNPDWPDGGLYSNDEYEYIELRNISGSPVTLYDSVSTCRGSSLMVLNGPSLPVRLLRYLPAGILWWSGIRLRLAGGIRLCLRARFTGRIAVIWIMAARVWSFHSRVTWMSLGSGIIFALTG